MKKSGPPRFLLNLLKSFCKPEYHSDIEGDLLELYESRQIKFGRTRANAMLLKEIIFLFRPGIIRSASLQPTTANVMIGSYVKTSMRNLARNKLFSALNIIGLAIGMSVGLLLIAFAHDLLSYDRFNEKGSRIYRVTSQAKFKQGGYSNFATTSVKMASLIKEKVPGVEDISMVRTEFSGDATLNGSVVPLTGLFAEPSMLQIFTFPMLKGNSSAALDKPYSIVLTETSAKKLFGYEDAFGKTLRINDNDYLVTGILKDVPFFSHIQFESLVSLSTIETTIEKDPHALSWGNVYQRNYVYLLLPENANVSRIQALVDRVCADENALDDEAVVHARLQPLSDIMIGEDLQNSLRPVMPVIVLWVIGGLALIVILSACFNYTNLSIARAMRRYKEIGLRKVIGAGSSQVRMQFFAEAVIISLISLIVSFGMFLVLRPQFLSIAPELLNMVKLEITMTVMLMFLAFATAVGLVAGFLPATFFARVNIINALRDAASAKIFRGVNFRRALVVVQYTLTLIFITSTLIGYVQYKNILSFDLGFNTENILNIDLQGNSPEQLINKLKTIPEVTGTSQSKIVTSVGNAWGGFLKYKDDGDSALVFTNIIDGNYIPLHHYHMIAGQNFTTRPLTNEATTEIIVNEKTLRLFNIAGGDSQKAIGEEISLSSFRTAGKKLTIVGVIKDFHYGKLNEDIKPVAFTYLTPDTFIRQDKRDGLVNVRLDTHDPMETMAKIHHAWKSVDPVHPIKAEFYDVSIEQAYSELSAMIKVIGFLSFIAISIASLGLLGMVVFSTETRLREISIRKVFGASSGSLVLLLSRNFVVMLAIAALIALPVTYIFFEQVVLTHFPFHEAIGISELSGGLIAVLCIAFIMIGSQTVRAAQRNPSQVLKNE